MDSESSTKFINSLAKYLQSLCNGCVNFNDWVQVTGHLYICVDTGKIVKYIVNEKLSKSLNTNITFTSRSGQTDALNKLQLQGKVNKLQQKSLEYEVVSEGIIEKKITILDGKIKDTSSQDEQSVFFDKDGDDDVEFTPLDAENETVDSGRNFFYFLLTTSSSSG